MNETNILNVRTFQQKQLFLLLSSTEPEIQISKNFQQALFHQLLITNKMSATSNNKMLLLTENPPLIMTVIKYLNKNNKNTSAKTQTNHLGLINPSLRYITMPAFNFQRRASTEILMVNASVTRKHLQFSESSKNTSYSESSLNYRRLQK